MIVAVDGFTELGALVAAVVGNVGDRAPALATMIERLLALMPDQLKSTQSTEVGVEVGVLVGYAVKVGYVVGDSVGYAVGDSVGYAEGDTVG